MAHGITLAMRKIRRPRPEIHAAATKWDEKGRRRRGDGRTYVNPHKDRSLPGKARRRARRAGHAS